MFVLHDRNGDGENRPGFALDFRSLTEPGQIEVKLKATFSVPFQDWRLVFPCSARDMTLLLEDLQSVTQGSFRTISHPRLGLSFLIEVPKDKREYVSLCLWLDTGWASSGIRSNSGPGLRITTYWEEVSQAASLAIAELGTYADPKEERSGNGDSSES